MFPSAAMADCSNEQHKPEKVKARMNITSSASKKVS